MCPICRIWHFLAEGDHCLQNICSNFFKNASSFQESFSTYQKMVSILWHYFHFSENCFQFPEKKQIYSKRCSLSIIWLFFHREWPLFTKYISPPFKKSLPFSIKALPLSKKLLQFSRTLLPFFRKMLPLSRRK